MSTRSPGAREVISESVKVKVNPSAKWTSVRLMVSVSLMFFISRNSKSAGSVEAVISSGVAAGSGA